MLNQNALRSYFDYRNPTPAQIRDRYEGYVDLSEKRGIEIGNIFDVLGNLKTTQFLILPTIYDRLLLDVPNSEHNLDDYRPRTRHFHHWRYAPDVRLNTTKMTLEDAEGQEFSLKSAVRNVSWDYESPHRGFGIVDVRSGEYTLWPFLYLLEGLKMQDLSPQLIQIETTDGYDVVGCVPALKSDDSEIVTLKNVPYLSYGEPHVLSTGLHSSCQCEWNHYGMRRGNVRRYRSGERIMCRHGVALYKQLIEERRYKILDGLVKPTGIMNLWWSLNKRTILGNKKLTITKMNALIGMLIGFMGVEKAFEIDFQVSPHS